jgi:RNA polymerase sigma factor (sigma-70 family)
VNKSDRRQGGDVDIGLVEPAAREPAPPEPSSLGGDPSGDFERFFSQAEPRLRRALVAAYGVERGREATADALAFAWEHWDRLSEVQNPTGYLYRVAQSRARQRRHRNTFEIPEDRGYDYEPKLMAALQSLSERQRLSVVLVHGMGWTLREVAELTGTKPTTVQNHLNRGLRHLRLALGVASHDH